MAKAYPIELRERIVASCDEGNHPAEVGRVFGITERYVYQLLRLRRETGSLEPKRGRPGPKPKLSAHVDEVLGLIEEFPDATLKELTGRLDVSVCVATLWKTLRELGITLKKSPARHRTAAS